MQPLHAVSTVYGSSPHRYSSFQQVQSLTNAVDPLQSVTAIAVGYGFFIPSTCARGTDIDEASLSDKAPSIASGGRRDKHVKYRTHFLIISLIVCATHNPILRQYT